MPRRTSRGTLDDTGADEVMRVETAATVRIMTLLHGGPLPARTRRLPMAPAIVAGTGHARVNCNV